MFMVYLLRMTGIFNMTENVNLRDFTSFRIFLISNLENLVISLISNKISVGVYEVWHQFPPPSKGSTSTTA